MAQLVRTTRFIGDITDEIFEQERQATIHDPALQQEEIDRCKASPYYFYTHYFLINGKPATTMLTEEEFNSNFQSLNNKQP